MSMSKDGDSCPVVPTPACPDKRREPLPWQMPKSLEDDPQAQVQAIIASPGYRQADQDVEFLNQDETRDVRLQIEFRLLGCTKYRKWLFGERRMLWREEHRKAVCVNNARTV